MWSQWLKVTFSISSKERQFVVFVLSDVPSVVTCRALLSRRCSIVSTQQCCSSGSSCSRPPLPVWTLRKHKSSPTTWRRASSQEVRGQAPLQERSKTHTGGGQNNRNTNKAQSSDSQCFYKIHSLNLSISSTSGEVISWFTGNDSPIILIIN